MNDTLSIALAVGSAILALASAVFSCFTYFRNVRHDRRRDTLDAFNTLQNEAFDKLNQIQPAEIREIAKNPKSTEYKTVSGYIARIEHFCAGVNLGIYDRKTVYSLANGYLDSKTIRSRIDPIIEKKQRNAEKDYFENIHKVLSWMQKQNTKHNKASEKHAGERRKQKSATRLIL